MARTKHANVYGFGVVKRGRNYTPLTAYSPYRKAPNKQAQRAINKSMTYRAKANVHWHKGTYNNKKQYRQAMKTANKFSREGGYRYAGTRQTQYGMAVVYKPTRSYKRRTRRNYKCQFAGSY